MEKTSKAFYDEFTGMYSCSLGTACRCLWLVIREHRGTLDAENDEEIKQALSDFEKDIRQYLSHGGSEKLRLAVKELVDENTKGMTEEASRRMCRKLAEYDMRHVARFAKYVNGDDDYVIAPEAPDEEGIQIKNKLRKKHFTAYCKCHNLKIDINKLERLITADEMAWLRVGMNYVGGGNDGPITPLQKCFRKYYHCLTDLGRIWAAQLLRHGIDMHDVEKETGVILHKTPGILYYIDRFFDVHRTADICVYDIMEAKELLREITHKANDNEEKQPDEEGNEAKDIEEKRKAILKYVGRLKGSVSDEFVLQYDALWDEILEMKSVKKVIYDKGRQKDTMFNRNLIGNILYLIYKKGIFKAGMNPTKMSRLLEPEKGEKSSVRGKMCYAPDDKSLKQDVENLIEKKRCPEQGTK